MRISKVLFRLTVVLCVCTVLVCGLLTDPLIHSAILKSDRLSGSKVFQAVNILHDRCRLIPSSKPEATEEEHVLYAVRFNDETVLSTSRETQLYRLVQYFVESAKDENDATKIYAAATTVCYLCRYDLDAERNTAYALVSRKGSCSNYSRTMQLLLEAVGTRALYVVGSVGKGKNNHAWNIVKLDDGSYLHCDATWCDNTQKIDRFGRIRPKLDYLLMNDEEAAESRKWQRWLYPKANADSEPYIDLLKAEFYG